MTNKIIFLAFILLTSSVSILFAQPKGYIVCGYVREQGSDERIIGATIISSSNGTASNSHGYYSLNIKHGYNMLLCSFLGYKPCEVVLNITSDTIVHIFLTPQTIQLEEVFVTGEKNILNTGEVGKITVNTTSLKYIPSFLGEQDIFKFLQILPGVSAGKEGSSALNIRGGSADQSFILLDDIPVYNQNHAFGFVSVFNGDALSNATLYKGFIPVDYGGRLSGVVALQMRDGDKYKHHQSINISTVSASVLTEGPIKKGKGSYLFSARRFIPDLFLRGYYAILGNENINRTLYTFYDITGKVNYKLNNKNTIFWSLYTGSDKINISTLDVASIYEGKDIKESKSGGGFGWGNLTSVIRLNTIINNRIFMNNTIYYSSLKNYNEFFYKSYLSSEHSKSQIKSGLHEIGFRIIFQQEIGSKHHTKYGVNGDIQHIKPQSIIFTKDSSQIKRTSETQKLNSLSLFINDQFKLQHIQIDVGGRLSLYNNGVTSFFSFEPRLSIIKNINNKNELWGSYIRNSQPLFSLNQYYMGMPIDFWVPFRKEKIQSSDQISVGWKNSSWENISLSTDMYYKKMKNLTLIYDSEDFITNAGGYDKATGSAYGIEFMSQYSGKRLDILVSYAFSKSVRNVNETRLPFIYDIPHDIKFFGKYTTLKKLKKEHHLSLNLGYRTGLPYILATENYQEIKHSTIGDILEKNGNIQFNPHYPNTRLNNFFRIDISYSMEKAKQTGSRTWQFSILNITNHKNPYMIFKDHNKYKSVILFPFMPSISYKRTF